MGNLGSVFLIWVSLLSGALVEAGANLNDCSKLKVKDLNDHPKSCGDERMTADCLNKFDAKGLSHVCLDKLKPKSVEDLTAKTVREITDGNKEDLPKTIMFMRVLLSKRKDWNEDKAKSILSWIVDDETFIEKLLDDSPFPRNLLAHLFIASTVPKLKRNTCSKFTKELVQALDSDAFKEITSACLHVLKPEVFEVMDAVFFKNINPKAFGEITFAQGEKIPVTAVKDMTEDQAKNWGAEPKLPPVNAKSGEDQAAQIKARKAYCMEHGCIAVRKWIDSTPGNTKSALHRRCDEILRNWGVAFTASIGMTLMFSAAAIAAFML